MAEAINERFCIACGMPLRSPADFWQGDTTKDYCIHCSREDGSMRSYEEAVVGMGFFLQKTQGMALEQAQLAAREYLAKMPAFQGQQ